MKLYCEIEQKIKEDGTPYMAIIQGPIKLPQNSKNISNLNILDEETLKTFGWLPVEQQTDDKLVFVSSSYEILEDKVIEKIITRDKTQEELSSQKEKENFYQWQQVRKQRDDLLKDSDKLVTIDRWENFSDEQKIKIKSYRQKLRDIPLEFTDPFSIIFPTL
jgi:hypothetical protein